jgi:hypothetical protein
LESVKKTNKNNLELEIKELEQARLKYYVKMYMRTRNRKIEKNIYYIFQNDLSARLSKSEFDYAVGFFKLLEDHFKNNFFSKIGKKVNM